MTRPSTQSVRRTAVDLSDQVAPHLAGARDTLVETVLPKALDTVGATRDIVVETVLPKALDTVGATRDIVVETVIPKAKEALPLARSALPKAKEALPGASGARKKAKAAMPAAKAAGAAVVTRAGGDDGPKKRHRLRKVVLLAALAAGAYAAWNAWRLPHGSDDWTASDDVSRVQTDADKQNAAPDPADASIPGVPVDTTRISF